MMTTTAAQMIEAKPEALKPHEVPAPPPKPAAKVRDPRDALKFTATTATIFAVLGHTVLGFEQTVFQMLMCLLTGYSTAIVFEWIDAKAHGRVPPFKGLDFKGWVKFLLAPHMTAITTSFLIYSGGYTLAMVFTVALGIASKYLFRVRIDGRYRHFFNPSNFGIAVALVLFPWMTVIPYQFTEDFYGKTAAGDVIIALIILGLGSRVNYIFTGRWPLILSWLGGYLVLGGLRALSQGSPLGSTLMPMTGLAFILFTLFMITDPMTSPSSRKGQIAFGLGIAVVYQALFMVHVIFTLFYAVVIVCAVRGLWLMGVSLRERLDSKTQKSEAAPIRAVA